MPRDLGSHLRHAAGRSNDVLWRGLAALAPALAAYFRASAPGNPARVAETYARLIARATADHGALVEAAGAQALIRKTGLGEILRDAMARDEAAARAERIAARYAIPWRLVEGAGQGRNRRACRAW